MWERLSMPWRACVEEAWASYCASSIPIGAVVTNREGEILSIGRNRIYEFDHRDSGQVVGNPLAHAEMNALISLDYETVDPKNAILYSTCEPCPLCIGALYMAGVRELRYASRDPYSGSVDLLQKTPYLRMKEVRVMGPVDPAFEHLLIIWLVEYKMRITDHGYKKVLDIWESVFPEAVAQGRDLNRSGILDSLREKGAGAEEFLLMLDQCV